MNFKNLSIICIFIIFGAMAIFYTMIMALGEDTCIGVLSGSSLYDGDAVYVQLTTANGTPIANRQVNVTLVDGNGGRNAWNLVTDSGGMASFELDGVAVGFHTLECVFGGSDGYKQSNATTTLEIMEDDKIG